MIARIWSGAVRREDADAYERYPVEHDDTVRHYEVAAGEEPR